MQNIYTTLFTEKLYRRVKMLMVLIKTAGSVIDDPAKTTWSEQSKFNYVELIGIVYKIAWVKHVITESIVPVDPVFCNFHHGYSVHVPYCPLLGRI